MDTIFALSSGSPPAGIAIIRVSGVLAGETLEQLAGSLPRPRQARLSHIRSVDGELLDQALVLWFPGPDNATGEDLAEFHLHGGRAVVAAVERALAALAGLRKAQPGEFTRRAFANGRIDLAEAEGLADLLSAETELQRQAALLQAGGHLSRMVENWREQLLVLSAELEAELDFSDEDDVGELPARFYTDLGDLADGLGTQLAAPRAEVLREGYRVALGGPPNAGKSTLFNALIESEAAITSPLAGTTRDVIERPVAISGVPLTFVDMAGLRGEGADAIEAIGIDRAQGELARADLVLWLGQEGEGPEGCWEIETQIDRAEHASKRDPKFRVSAVSGENLDLLRAAIVERARVAMPKPGQAALNDRQHALVAEAHNALSTIVPGKDLLLLGEDLRLARLAFDRLIGRTATEDMLDALFGRFCIGK